ncbi:MAG: hypothetical protein AAGI53_08355 [Planctomycetota bacterium]
MTTAPKLIRYPLLLISVAVGGLFCWSLFTSAFATENTIWPGLGFSLVGVAAAVFGVMLGLGMFRNGFGLAALCVAGAALTSGVLGWLDLRANLASAPDAAKLLRPWLAAVAASGLASAALAGLAVLIRSGRSWRFVIGGGVAFAALGGLGLLMQGPGAALTSRWEDGPEAVRISLLLIVAFSALVLLSAGGHLLIRGFEVTLFDDSADAKGASAS